MAPKNANPIEDPPAAPSEEEEEDSDEEETSSGEEEEDDEETPEPTKLPSPPSKQITPKKPTAQVATPAKSSSSDDEETGSDSESESDPEPTPKPIKETTSKARSSKPVLKRANETEGAQKDAKRKKKKGTGAEEEEEEPPSEMKKPKLEPGEEMKKQLFQRLWSEDDEIAVLKGMMEFSTKKGIDPNQDMNAFHDFIKKSLHIDVSRTQLMDKIRRLKKKYVNNLKRGLKKGEDVNFSKPHEQKAYELSKKIWGGDREDGNGIMDSVKKVQSQKGKVNGPKEADSRMQVDVVKEESTLKITDVEKVLLDRSIGVGGLEDYVINNGLNMVEASKKKELEKRWKELQIAQLELFVERTNLIREQAMLMLDHFQSSDDN